MTAHIGYVLHKKLLLWIFHTKTTLMQKLAFVNMENTVVELVE